MIQLNTVGELFMYTIVAMRLGLLLLSIHKEKNKEKRKQKKLAAHFFKVGIEDRRPDFITEAFSILRSLK